ncbi:MAG: 16S rRNA (adenine(1518)-N(6)/adenine(1519)-N(6))-dimethyltransferase [Defluviitaleaceae bacterium]|nr:16S rRNA (adenine(1518)-N(6)/adenine(1519)-N(6))-dimethyltransferase [Defluviitaleaceae bacterium]
MLNLSTAAGVREIFSRYDLRAKKKLGQNFLIDGHVLGKIITAANIRDGDRVLEIGPGIGGMTQALLRAGADVTAIELDKQLVPILQNLFAGEKLRIIQGDVLRMNLHEIFDIPSGGLRPPTPLQGGAMPPLDPQQETARSAVSDESFDGADPGEAGAVRRAARPACEVRERGSGETFSKVSPEKESANIKAVANLPYYITTPVIFALLESGLFESVTVMVQKEVAKRFSAGPGTKDYGSLSLAAQYFADATLVANVPSNCFMPRPAVDSAVVRLDILPAPRVDADHAKLFRTIHAAFGKRRKTLLNALDSEFPCGKPELAEILRSCDIDPQARGETLDIYAFARLSERLAESTGAMP